MSVILDALRRRRRESPVESSTRGVPTGLGLTSAVSEVSRQRDQRFKLLGLAVVLVLVGVWLGLRFNSRDVAPSSSLEPHVAAVEPRVPTPEPRVESPKPRVQSPEPRVESPESRSPNPEPRVPSPDHFALALRYQSLGDFDRARSEYMAVLADDESNVEARNNLGLLYHSRRMTAEAIEQFRRAIQLNPRYAKAHSNLAVILTSQGRLAEARAELRTALDIETRSPDLLVNLALVEKADQHPDQAAELLLRALGASPGHAAAHYNLAVLYDERASLALAVDHYNAFLRYAGPEHGALLAQVQGRVRAIEPRLPAATN